EPQLRDLTNDLVVRRVDEAVELDLTHRAVAAQRKADRGADDAGLGERRVDHPVFAEVLLQPVGDPEDAAELADVLAHQDDLVVGLHGRPHAIGERLGQRDLGHRAAPSVSKDARYSANAAFCSASSGDGSAYTWSKVSRMFGSGIARQPSRSRAAISSASVSTPAKNSSSARPFRFRYASTRAIGSLSFQCSSSSLSR